MVDVGAKPLLRRMAIAVGEILLQPETIRLIRENGLKKGDVLGVARIAGIHAAKSTPQLIPLCHNVTLDAIHLDFKVGTDRVTVEGRAECVGRTGVEMEAITAVSVALITIYDMCKAVDKEMTIGAIRLIEKHKLDPTGTPVTALSPVTQKAPGKTGHHGNLKVMIVTLSDRAASGEYEDRSGPRIRACLEESELMGRWSLVCENILIPDDESQFRLLLTNAIASGVDVILTTGSTGVGLRDMAPDVVGRLIEKQLPGIMESIRMIYGRDKPMARLSRGVAGIAGTSQIYTLPGSVRAVEEYMKEILKTVEHIVFLLRDIDPHG
jgi:cyclic pyranopterin phosphate synthase